MVLYLKEKINKKKFNFEKILQQFVREINVKRKMFNNIISIKSTVNK